MARYNPPTKVQSISIPYLALVTRADEEFQRRKHREVEYEFAGKVFLADPYIRGAYDGELLSASTLSTIYNNSVTQTAADDLAQDWQRVASRMTEAIIAGYHFAYTNVSKSAEAIDYVFSGYFKSAGRNLTIGFGGQDTASGIFAVIDLQSGYVIRAPAVYGGNFVAGILQVELISNGYFHISITGTSDTDAYIAPFVQLDNNFNANGGAYTGDGVSGVLYTNLSLQELTA